MPFFLTSLASEGRSSWNWKNGLAFKMVCEGHAWNMNSPFACFLTLTITRDTAGQCEITIVTSLAFHTKTICISHFFESNSRYVRRKETQLR